MKLSYKGLKKFERWQEAKRLGHPYPVNEIEFEHDDFVDCVVLTVEEAKFISKLLPMTTIWAGKEAGKAIKEVVDVLDKQVEQVEKGHE